MFAVQTRISIGKNLPSGSITSALGRDFTADLRAAVAVCL